MTFPTSMFKPVTSLASPVQALLAETMTATAWLQTSNFSGTLPVSIWDG